MPHERGRLVPSRRTAVLVAAVVGVAVAGGLGLAVALRSGPAHAQPGAPPRFVDETATSGIDHAYTGEFDFFVGGGVAAFDCDADGFDDLYFAGGSSPAGLYHNDSSVGGELRFTQVESPVTDLDRVTGAYPIDIDSDGAIDLMVLRNGTNELLRGLGGCRFEAAGAGVGLVADEAWTVGFSATWEGDERLPTLAFGNYLVGESRECDDSTLVRPDPAGDRYGAPIPLTPGYCTLSVLFSDWGRTGERDLRMTNDRHYYTDGSEQLWRVVPGETPREYTEADGWRPLRIWGMGIASEDITGDGYPEVFLTSQGDNKLQTLDDGPAQPSYHDVALPSGATAQRPYAGDDVLPSTAWHPEFGDVNDDGFVDLLITKGNVEAQPDFASSDPTNLLLGQPDGTFVEGGSAAGIDTFTPSRGAALVDLNLDGQLDLVVVHRRVGASVWRNVGTGTAAAPSPMGHWLGIRLSQPAPNVDAIGAWLEVRVGDRTTTREVTIGGGHAGGQLGWIHVGLGDAETAEVRVEWPDGELGEWAPVAADQFVSIARGADRPETIAPGD